MAAVAPPVRVLFVDDDPLVLNSLQRVLRHEPMTMWFCTDPLEAISLMAVHDIEVIVSDLMMPGLDGRGLLGLVKRHHPRLVRVLLSGQDPRDSFAVAVEADLIHHRLIKPWDNTRLKEQLRGALDQAVMQRAALPHLNTGR